LYDSRFEVRSIMPAAFGLAALAIAVTTGIVVRSVTASLVAGLVVAGAAVLVLAYPVRPHLLPASRQVTPISTSQEGAGAMAVYTPATKDAWLLGSGTLNAAGQVVDFDFGACTLPAEPVV